jgi:hypothetical protein
VSDLNNYEIRQHERRVSQLDGRLAVFLATMRETALALEKQIQSGELQSGNSGPNPAAASDSTPLRERLRNIQSTIFRLEQCNALLDAPAADSQRLRR